MARKPLIATPRVWTNQPVALYHGTIDRHVPSILAGVDATKGRRFAHFGRGFYTTTLERQARTWAWELSRQRPDRTPPWFDSTPIVTPWLRWRPCGSCAAATTQKTIGAWCSVAAAEAATTAEGRAVGTIRSWSGCGFLAAAPQPARCRSDELSHGTGRKTPRRQQSHGVAMKAQPTPRTTKTVRSKDSFWGVVEDCLITFHHLAAPDARSRSDDLRRTLDNPPSGLSNCSTCTTNHLTWPATSWGRNWT